MEEIVPFAKTNFRNKDQVFGIKTDDRRRHMYIIGKTGSGKSTLLKNMMIADIRAGRGVGIIDPHGEFAETILDYVPESRKHDVVYFNPADMDFPIAFNIAENVGPRERHLVASGLIGIFKKLWADSWGPRLEYVLRNTILALLECPDSTLLGIMRMLSDKDYRKQVLEQVTDPVIRAFWLDEFAKYSSKFEVEAIAPIQNKVGQFLTNPLIRNIVGQQRSAINIRDIMDNKKILVVNVSKGRIGEDTSKLLGAMIITKIQQAAMSRINVPEEERQDFFLYVDEFQNFATESFADILSEARKYRLSLILAHQYVNQLIDEVKDAVMGNVGTLTLFRIGAEDAEFFEKEFAPEVNVQSLVNLPNHKIYLKLMIDGVTSNAFSADTLPPIKPEELNYKDEIIEYSRGKYASKRTDVENTISTWSKPVVEAPPKPDMKMYNATCSRCKKITQVPFEPDPKRSVFCKECYAEVQREESKDQKSPLQAQAQQPKIVLKKAMPSVKIDTREVKEIIEKNERSPKASISPQSVKQGKFKVLGSEKSEISLAEAFKIGAQTFSGKRIIDEELPKNDDADEEKKGISGTIKPGETVKF
ncbi:type IV secretion system DNA-binding domain-containing protein [Candidatus Azambacteria bacterium]|nr:type IV secretion system DNA-binding domain-containing protein [Candidatus Azambacteria bacterium]